MTSQAPLSPSAFKNSDNKPGPNLTQSDERVKATSGAVHSDLLFGTYSLLAEESNSRPRASGQCCLATGGLVISVVSNS